MKIQNILLSMMAVAGTLLTGCSDDDAKMPANPTEPVAVKDASNDIIYEVNPRYYGQSNCFSYNSSQVAAYKLTCLPSASMIRVL